VTDPFDTARLRAAVLAAWRDSPTRFREDANAEEDLYLGGYRDRLLVELAQNAADAALDAGEPGALRVSIVDNELRVANTGAPLTADGVNSLASLRASAKGDGANIGRFGVGFAAVLAVCDEPRVASRTGAVAFSSARTRAAAGVDGRVPVLRLPWATDEEPPAGFDTEVRLPLRSGVDPRDLLAAFVDLLLSLDGLARIEIDGRTWQRERADASTRDRLVVSGPDGHQQWVVERAAGELPAELVEGLAAESRPQWTVCWAVRLDDDGMPLPFDRDVLHAPTRTDERLSLPARLIATMPIEPSRRRVLPGPATDVVLAAAARCYPALLRSVGVVARLRLVPLPGFPLSEVDEELRELVLAELHRADRLLPLAGPNPRDISPAGARLVPVPSRELADALADFLDGLVDGELAAPANAAALAALGVRRMRLADVVAEVTGRTAAPSWWRRLYAALAEVVDADPTAAEELAAIPVPLVDGRTRPGARGVLLLDADLDLSTVDVLVVHPEAAHPVLERLGARRGGPADVLDALQDAVERSVEDVESGLDTRPLAELVLRLVSDGGERPWLGALALPDTAGDWRRADELALPDSPLLAVLDQDSPLGVVADDLVATWPGQVLTRVGVLGSFSVVDEEEPTGPDHDLPDEADWWAGLSAPPTRLVAVRDLDLVADHAWPAALRLLAGAPDTWRALHHADGHTSWWLARHALLASRPARAWRLPDADSLAGLYDPVPDVGVDLAVLTAAGVRATLSVESTVDAEELLDRLADQDRAVPPGAALRAHAVLATAVRDGDLDPADLDPPARLRTVSGAVAAADECVVLDAPWWFAVSGPTGVVSAGADFALAEPLAELLDLPLAGDGDATMVSTGEMASWASLGAVVDACDLAGLAVPPGGPLVHDRLVVRAGDAAHDVPWWFDDRDVLHCADSTEGLSRALAWAAGDWPARHTLAALLDDPDTYLS